MNARELRSATALTGLSLLLAACGSSNGPSAGAVETDARYALANGCFALQDRAGGRFVRQTPSGFDVAAASLADAEAFYLKPTALGRYMLYARDGNFFAAAGAGIGRETVADDNADWTVDSDSDGNFRLSLASSGQSLAVSGGGLTLSNQASNFAFPAINGCTAFPEIEVNATGTPFKGRGVDQPALGFADVHVHITATDFLGHAHAGRPFHRFGVSQALPNCDDRHGKDGRADYVGNFESYGSPFGQHDTSGWPTFSYWPNRGDLTHEQTYYKWLERAWRGGERLLVNFLVENGTLCHYNSLAHGLQDLDCNEMDSVRTQVQQITDLQDYIDAQEGGPGKGWFRIVTSPAQARQVINDGKLAVVLGIEASHLFDCSEKLGKAQCDEGTVDRELAEFRSLGVRVVFPMHEFNNAYGGNGIFDAFLDVGNFLDTGEFWQTYDCPDEPYFYGAGAVLGTTPQPAVPASMNWVQLAHDEAPAAPAGSGAAQCNSRSMTDLGRYLMQQLMANRMMIEIDHMELQMKEQAIELAEAQVPFYPLMSSHGAQGGLTLDQAQRVLNIGGLIYPYKGNGRDYVNFLQRIAPLENGRYNFAVGFGADTNGLGHQAQPRSGGTPVSYPFTLFQGDAWSAEWADAAPVVFDQQRSGEHVYNTDVDGFAHYGMMADFVEEVAIEGGQPAIDTLFHSAEAYLQMWERVENR